MWQNILIVLAFVAAALLIYRSIDKLIEPLLPFRQIRKPADRKVIVLKDDDQMPSGKTGSSADHSQSPGKDDPLLPGSNKDSSGRSSLPLGV